MGSLSRSLAGLSAAAFSSLAAAACVGASGPRTTPLVELYTSQGCGSCRPAERWLADLRRSSEIAGITLHLDLVDYGPPEARVRRRVDRRNHGLARARRVIVTSPRVLLQGRPADWSTPAFRAALEGEAGRPEAAHIAVDLARRDAVSFAASIRIELAAADATRARLFYAGFARRALEPAADTRAGMEEAAILQWSGPVDIPADGRLAFDAVVVPPPGTPPERSGFVAFVETGPPPRVAQALMLPLCRNAGVR